MPTFNDLRLLPLSALLETTLAKIEAEVGRRELLGVPTGFAQLDDLTGGWQRSDLIVLAGRPAMGKTSLALGTALHAARLTGQPVAFFSGEAKQDQLARLLLCCEAKVDTHRLLVGRLERDDWPLLVQAFRELSDVPLHFADETLMTIEGVAEQCRRLHAGQGLGLVVVDCLQLLRATTEHRRSRGEELSEHIVALKELAGELDVPVIVTSQLRRGLDSREDKRPRLCDLRDSGAIEVVADLVLFVYRGEVYTKDKGDTPGTTELIVGKHRHGPLGTAVVRFVREFRRFEDDPALSSAPQRTPL